MDYANVKGAAVHKGFYTAYTDVRSQVLDIARNLRTNYPDLQLYVTGICKLDALRNHLQAIHWELLWQLSVQLIWLPLLDPIQSCTTMAILVLAMTYLLLITRAKYLTLGELLTSWTSCHTSPQSGSTTTILPQKSGIGMTSTTSAMALARILLALILNHWLLLSRTTLITWV